MTSACSGPSEGSITLPPQAPPGTGVTSRLRHGLIARLSAVAVLLLGLTAGLAGSGLARTGPESIAPLAEKLLDAVVNISTTQTVKGSSGAPLPNVPKGSPFEELFDDFFKKGKGRTERKQSSLGSGFVIDGKEGLIVTNFHVIDGADEIIINFNDGTKLKVEKVIGKDTKTDLALLKVTPKKPLAAVPWGPSAKVRVGDWVVAIGNPFGLGGSVSVGIISAKQRDISSGPYDDYLQTDAAINKGNSGGPLFNMDGEVIGVNTAIISPSGGSIGIGFAVPSETAIFVVDQLRRHGEIRRGWLGVNVQSLNEGLSEEFGSPPGVGALVTRVTPGSPADAAGIKARDVIVRFDGKDISTMRGLPRAVAQTEVGREVEAVVLRDGQRISFKVKVARRGAGSQEGTGARAGARRQGAEARAADRRAQKDERAAGAPQGRRRDRGRGRQRCGAAWLRDRRRHLRGGRRAGREPR